MPERFIAVPVQPFGCEGHSGFTERYVSEINSGSINKINRTPSKTVGDHAPPMRGLTSLIKIDQKSCKVVKVVKRVPDLGRR